MAQNQPRSKSDTASLSLWQRIRLAFARSFLAHFFLDTSVLHTEKETQGVLSRLFHFFTALPSLKKTKRFLVRHVEQSRLIRLVSRFTTALFHTPLRSFGMFFLAFGVFLMSAALIFPARYQAETQMLTWILAAILIFCALLLLFSQKTLSRTVYDSRFFSALFFKILGSRQKTVEQEITVKTSDALAFVCGIIFALPTLLLPTPTVLLIYTLIVLGYFTLLTPESGFVLLLFFIPFCSTAFLLYALLFLFAVFFIKVILGRRTLHFHRMDYPILLLLLAILICGSISVHPADSVKTALLYASLLCGYFLATNMIKTASWLYRCVFALSVSALFTAMDGLLQFVFDKMSDRWQTPAFLTSLKGYTNTTFDSPDTLASYLVLMLPILFALLHLQCKEEKKRPWAILPLLAVSTCLILTWEKGAWLAALIGCSLFCLLAGRRSRILFCSLALAFGISLPFLPDVFLTHLRSIVSLNDAFGSYRTQVFRASLTNLRQFWHTGIGMGDTVFSTHYGHLSPAVAAHSHHLFLQIWIALGVIGLLLFAWVLLYFLRIFTLTQKTLLKASHDQTQLLSFAFFCALLSSLVQGLTDYVFYEPRIFFLFFILGALLVSLQRIHYQEYHRPHHAHSTVSAYSIDLPRKKESRRAKKLKKDA